MPDRVLTTEHRCSVQKVSEVWSWRCKHAECHAHKWSIESNWKTALNNACSHVRFNLSVIEVDYASLLRNCES